MKDFKEPDKSVVEDVIPEEWKFLMNDVIPEKANDIWPDDIPEDVRAFHLSLSKNFKEQDIILKEVNDVLSDDIPEDVKAFHEAESKKFIEEDVIIPEEALDVIPEEKDDLVALTTKLMSTGNEDDYKLEIDNKVEDVGQLSERIDRVQKSLVHLRQYSPGSGEVRLEYLDDIDRDSVKSDGMYLKYQQSTKKWIGATSTSTGWEPSGYEYTGDASLALIVNEVGAVNGLEIEENTWTVIPCVRGNADNQLPSSFSGRIWDDSTNRFSFAEVPTDGVVLFRVNVDVYPETNNALLTGRIRFVAVNDGLENVLNEDGDRIVLEDDSGNITGDYFESYSFFQTVAAQEMAGGAGVVHERTFIFPVYVGNANAQRGWGQFELNASCDFTLYDSSILGVLN